MRFRHRGYVAALLLVGVVVSVGGYPYGDGTRASAASSRRSWTRRPARRLRSTPRAVPLVVLALALALGFGAPAVGPGARRARLPPLRRRGAGGRRRPAGAWPCRRCSPAGEYSAGILRDEAVPADWQARDRPRSTPATTRPASTSCPGADFASYRWGGTVDPITPGLMDRPYVARELVPWGSAPSADLLNAFEERLQDGVFEPAALAPVRPADLGRHPRASATTSSTSATARPSPGPFWQQVLTAGGLAPPVAYGPATPNRAIARLPLHRRDRAGDAPRHPRPAHGGRHRRARRARRSSTPSAASRPAGGGRRRRRPRRRRRRRAARRPRRRPVLGGARRAGQLDQALADGADLVVTDTNRRRARRWGSVQRERRLHRAGRRDAARRRPHRQPPRRLPRRRRRRRHRHRAARRALGRGHRRTATRSPTRPRTAPPTPSTATR